jgi:aspartyl-tRNA(Asn)/glutamyl-tRNA(Gln) amidotransferase subunit A
LNGYFERLSPDVRLRYEAALERLTRAGMAVGAVSLDAAETIPTTYVNLVLPEAAAWHAPILAARGPSYTPRVRERLEAGLEIRAVDYLAARQARRHLREAVTRAMDDADALVLPTLPILAPPLGAAEVTLDGGSSIPVRTAMLRQTQPFNITGHPAISLPIWGDGLPVGLQIVGRWGDTARLLALAASCEKIVC